jgi:uncharacterized protein
VDLPAASFDCSKATTTVEHLVCDTPLISKLDETLDKDYRDVLAKATEKQKLQIRTEQRHWLTTMRNACKTTTCLKHAYWSRQAALETYFAPRSPLYKDESEKATLIKKVLDTASLKRVYDAPICNEIYDGLTQMKGIQYINPVVQTQSYQDPVVDPWKKSCQSAPPFNFSFFCEPNIEPTNGDDVLKICNVSYGLPPFKLYVLPPATGSQEKRYIFYNDDSYGLMNWEHEKKSLGNGFVGFREISPSKCLGVFGNLWNAQGKAERAPINAYLETNSADPGQPNYNSLIQYRGKYYFLVLYKSYGRYWMTVKPVVESKSICRWAP